MRLCSSSAASQSAPMRCSRCVGAASALQSFIWPPVRSTYVAQNCRRHHPLEVPRGGRCRSRQRPPSLPAVDAAMSAEIASCDFGQLTSVLARLAESDLGPALEGGLEIDA